MNCLNPQTIYNKYLHRYVTVPCCKCETCLIQKQNILASRCSNECKKHLCNLFFTLTYTNNYVPLLAPHSNIIHLRRRNLHILSRRMINGVIHKDYEFLDDYEIIPSSKYNDIQIDNLFAKDISNDIDGVAHSKYTGVLSKRDINLFLKRLRYEISKTEFKTEKLRYILIGEHGGERNRPHYHGIIHTNNPMFGEWLRQNILKIWRMCDINAMSKKNRYGSDGLPKFVDASSVCNYVTKYVSMYDSGAFGCKQFPVKPFLLTSKNPYYGLSTHDELLVKEVISNNNPSFERLVKSGNEFVNIETPLSIENRLWYRFDGIDKYDVRELCEIALRFFKFPDCPKGRFSRFVIKRVKEFNHGVESVTFPKLFEYIEAVRSFVNRLRAHHLRLQMSKPFNVSYLMDRINTWSDCLHILSDKYVSSRKFSEFCESIYKKFLDCNIDLSEQTFSSLAENLFNLKKYQLCVLHDFRIKYRKQVLGKHMSNLNF